MSRAAIRIRRKPKGSKGSAKAKQTPPQKRSAAKSPKVNKPSPNGRAKKAAPATPKPRAPKPMNPTNPIKQPDPRVDGSSVNVLESNIEQLRELFPAAFTESSKEGGPRFKIDFDVLRQLLGDVTEDEQERYSFTWNGKARARRIALAPSTATLRPARDESVHWDDTKHLFIEGDNLEVLKLLQKSYHRAVKLIYIDPPYNTGKDFIYPDNYADTLDTYLRYTGQITDEGFKVSPNSETSGRFHTNWLNMMLPRLKLARSLLRDDGFIIVSIDDAELANLRALLNDVFGEENFLATLVWDRNRKNDAKFFSVGHEYMLVYARDRQRLRELDTVLRAPKPGVDEVRAAFERLRREHRDDWSAVGAGLRELYRSWDDDDPRKPLERFNRVDERGPYRDDGNINWPGGGGPRYTVLHPRTGKPCKVPTSGWRYPTPQRMQEEIDAGRVVFGPDETTVPRVRMNMFDSDGQVMHSVQFSYAQTAANQFIELFDGKRVFENPKHFEDLRALVEYLTGKDDIVLDFFAGSCSTAHAVLLQNLRDGGTRRFVVVQLPEPCPADSEASQAGLETIAEIGKERIRRAGRRLLDQIGRRSSASPLFPSEKQEDELDVGFRVFKLDSSNIKPWDADFDTLEEAVYDAADNIKSERSEEDVLYELLLKYGLDLAVPIEERKIAGKTVYSVGAGALIVCLAKSIGLEVVEGIAKLKEELKPEVMRVVFRDSGFKDDVVKTNAVQILKQAGLDEEQIRSL